MGRIGADEYRQRYKELLSEKLDEICLQLNDEYDDVIFYVRDGKLYIDCSDFSQRDVEIS